jgi:hypothetical protein
MRLTHVTIDDFCILCYADTPSFFYTVFLYSESKNEHDTRVWWRMSESFFSENFSANTKERKKIIAKKF